MQDKCKHINIHQLGSQEIPNKKPIMLYNCLECKSTITIDPKEYFMWAVNSFWYGIKKKKKD